MKDETTIKRELGRVRTQLFQASCEHRKEPEDWLYGALVALEWASGSDTMSPSKAFSWGEAEKAGSAS